MSPLSKASLHTQFATLDVANTRKQLESCFSQTQPLNRLLIDIFHEASAASAESASHFLQRKIQYASDADRVAGIVKSFAGAVPKHNIPSLAQLCAFLAVSFSTPLCSAPLETFVFSESATKRQAISAVISRLSYSSRAQTSSNFPIPQALDRIYPFFEHLISDQDSSIRRDAIHALISLPSISIPPDHISAFLNRLPASPSPFSSKAVNDESGYSIPDQSFEAFLTLSIARGITSKSTNSQLKPKSPSSSPSSNPPTFQGLLVRVLLRAVDFSSATTLHHLNSAFSSHLVSAIPDTSLDIFLFIISLLAASLASAGRLSECSQSITIAQSIANDPRLRNRELHPIVKAVVKVITISIVSLASAASASQLSELTSLLFKRVDDEVGMKKGETLESTSDSFLIEKCDHMITAATDADCPAALSLILTLRALLSRWVVRDAPFLLPQWLEKDIVHMMTGTTIFSSKIENSVYGQDGTTKGGSELLSSGFARDEEEYYNSNSQYEEQLATFNALEDESSLIDRTILSMCAAVTSLVCLHHSAPSVRLAAADTLAQFPDAPVMLFFLPAIMRGLSVETEPAVAIRILQDVILCDSLLKNRETAGIVLKSTVQVMRSVTTQLAPSKMSTAERVKDTLTLSESSSVTPEIVASLAAILQTGMVGVARAANLSPGRVTKILVVEIENLRSRFENISAGERIAGAAGILALVKERPARGSKFIPFITLCIQKESLEIAPEATAMCLEAMFIMCDEEVMDPSKTVKIVIKKLPDILKMNRLVRTPFLKLIRCAAMDARSKKGRTVAETVIDLLRKCVIEFAGIDNDENGEKASNLDWNHVREASESLIKFSINDILRIAYGNEEPLLDLEAEKERLKKIEEHCGLFVGSVLDTANRAQGSETRESLQRLLAKIAKHEWDERPRGNFDPERIAKLRATSKALERTRKRLAATATETAPNARNSPSEAQNSLTNNSKEDDEVETIGEQFAHAVEGMPLGVIRTLCSSSAKMDQFSMRACALAGAVTNALPWISLVEERMSKAASEFDGCENVDTPIVQDEVMAACLCVLRLGNIGEKDKSELKQMRRKWFAPERLSGSGEKESVELFLGMTLFDGDWRLTQAMQFVHSAQVVHALIINAIGQLPKSSNAPKQKDNRSKAVHAVLAMIEQRENEGSDEWSTEERDKIEAALCSHGKEEIMSLVWVGRLSALRVRLICRIGEGGAVRTVAAEVVNGIDRGLAEDMELLRQIGSAVAKLRLEVRKGLICEFAEKPNRTAACVICHALGASAWLPNIKEALTAALVLCDTGERVAVGKLSENGM